MGKNSRRTKNNTKPSNSQRSAELLEESGYTFSGFSNMNKEGFVSCVKNIDMNHMDRDVQFFLKKMGKKCCKTKYKALKGFTKLCAEVEKPILNSTLPCWPRVYSCLAIDIDNRVREGVQIAHAALVKRLGKRIEKYLKELIGVWFISQYDTYPPASSAAQNSFNNTFPQRKAKYAIIYFQDEILTFIWKNIIIETAQSLFSNKSITPEEMEVKYYAILISNLQAYAAYLRKVTIEEIEKTIDIHQKIISDGKFWKLAKHQEISVKTAFYDLLTAIMRHANCLLKDEKKKIIPTIMNSIEETEPSLVSTIWEAIIMAINVIEDWHQFINVEKTILPKLYFILKNGQNCVSIVYPNILPFLSHLMKLDINKEVFFTKLFENMRKAMPMQKFATSRSKVRIIATTFFECFRYVVHSNSTDLEICNNLMKEQLIPIIKMILSDTVVYRSTYFSELASLIRYWSKNRETSDSNCYSELIISFWVELTNLYKDIHQSTNYSTCLTNFSDLLVSLRSTQIKIQKNMKVTFSDSTDSEKDEFKVEVKVVDNDKKFINETEEFINSFCSSYIDEVINNPNKNNYENLIELSSKFESKQFFDKLAQAHNSDADLFKFYEDNLMKWMLNNKEDAKCLIPLIFNIFNYINEDNQTKILESLLEFKDEILLFHAVKSALMIKNQNSSIVKIWCHNSAVTELLINIAQNLVLNQFSDKYPQSDVLLQMAFKVSDDGDSFISEDAINGVSSVICKVLNNMCTSPAEYIVSNTDVNFELFNDTEPEDEIQQSVEKDDMPYLAISNLIKLQSNLLALTLEYNKIFSGSIKMLETILLLNMTDDLIVQIDSESEWQKVLRFMIKKMSNMQITDLVKTFSSIFWEKVFESIPMQTNDVEQLREFFIYNNWTKIASMFLKEIYENKENYEFSELQLLFFYTLDATLWMKNAYQIILSAEIMSGNMYIPELELKVKIWTKYHFINITNEKVADYTDKCLIWAIISMKVMSCVQESLMKDDVKVYLIVPELMTSIVELIKLGHKYSRHFKLNEQSKHMAFFLAFLEKLYNLNTPINEPTSETLDHVSTRYGTITSNSEDIHTLLAIRTMHPIMNDCNDNFNRIMDKIVQKCSLEPSLLLQDCNIHTISWEKMLLPLEFIRAVTVFIESYPRYVTTFQWDFILISLVSWQNSVNQSKNHYDDFKVMTFTVAVCQLYCVLQSLILKHKNGELEDIPPELLDEWKNVFIDNIHSGVAKAWMLCSDLYNQEEIPLVATVLLNNMGKALRMIDSNIFFKKTQDVSVNCTELMKASLKLLQSQNLILKMSAYHALNHVIIKLVKKDEEIASEETFDAKSLSIYQFENILDNMRSHVEVVLSDLKLDSVNISIQPYSHVCICIFGYLFVWKIVLDMCAEVDQSLRYYYSEMLRNNHFYSLMDNIFKLLPIEYLMVASARSAYKIFHLTPPSFKFGETKFNETLIWNMVSCIYTDCLRHLPVLVRQWWNTTDSRTRNIADRITTIHVSPILCQEEMEIDELVDLKVNTDNMQLKTRPSTREVIATYEMDDTKFELDIELPVNYPLGRITVTPGSSIRGGANWANSHMQLSLFLNHQNGSIWEGLVVWKKNLERRFIGVEECYICFSTLHFNTYDLPKLSCRTCQKKFHKLCLYKWFNTSQKSTCPICRYVF